jgi:3-dehydroquinate synthase
VSFGYPVHFTRHLFASTNPLLKEVVGQDVGPLPKKTLMVIDRGVHQHHPHLPGAIEAYCRQHQACLTLAGPPLVIEGGEAVKNDPRHVARVHRAIHAAGLCRHSYVVAIGGGAVIDAVGFAAATAHRGLRLIRVPTTVLAQGDAAIGVKNGINAFGKKNFLGTFAPPRAVLNDFAFLTTLSPRDWLSGVAEAVKVALIKDASFFTFLEEQAGALTGRRLKVMEQVIYRCAALHLEHIAGSGDPFELGASRPLDFGHWSAHKLEQLTGYELRHGEAVAIGIALDTTYSYLAGLLPPPDWQRVLAVLANLGFALYCPELETDRLLQGLDEFREHLGGRLTIMLLWNIGQGLEVHKIDVDLIRASIAVLRKNALGDDKLVAKVS